MKLVRDLSPAAHEVDRPCLHCGQMEQLAKMVIDIEGPAFQAYYHPECADSVRRTLKIYRADLKRRGLL